MAPRRQRVWLFDLDDTLHDAANASMPGIHVAMGEYMQRELQLTADEAQALRRRYWLRYGATLLGLVRELNQAADVDGILVQFPVPNGIRQSEVIATIDPRKDVDGLHAVNAGALWSGQPRLVPCTPRGCMRLLSEAGVRLEGARAVVVGRSNLVGKPIAGLLLAENATVTLAHSKTRDLPAVCREAEVLVAAVGRAKMIPGAWVRPGAVVIDVGMNRKADNSGWCGDVDFAGVSEVASAITPVPGGVGPMTIAMLMHNTLQAARLQTAPV